MSLGSSGVRMVRRFFYGKRSHGAVLAPMTQSYVLFPGADEMLVSRCPDKQGGKKNPGVDKALCYKS